MKWPFFFPAPEYATVLPRGRCIPLRTLCERAGVTCRVTGPPAERLVILGRSPQIRAICLPGPLSAVWLGIPTGSRQDCALLALGLMAYGLMDYGARECLRGKACARPGPGRPRAGKALSAAERQRNYRARKKISQQPGTWAGKQMPTP